MNIVVAVVAIVPAALLFLDAANFARLDVSLLRWIVSVCAALLFAAARRFSPALLLILCGILFVFNPLFPVHFAYVDPQKCAIGSTLKSDPRERMLVPMTKSRNLHRLELADLCQGMSKG